MSTIRLSDLDFDGEIFEFEDLLAQNRLDHLTYPTLTAMEEDASLEVNDSAVVNNGIFDIHEVIDVENEEDMTDPDTIYYYNGTHYYGNNGGEAIGFETVNGFAILSKKNTFVTPEMFGAAGNGTIDDAASIQGCIDYAKNNGYIVALTGKTYRCRTSVNVGHVFIIGAGTGNKTVLKFEGTDGVIITDRNTVLANVEITQTVDKQGAGIEFYTGNSNTITDVIIENVTITHFEYGLKATRSTIWSNEFNNIRLQFNKNGLYIDSFETALPATQFCNIFNNLTVLDNPEGFSIYLRGALASFYNANISCQKADCVHVTSSYVEFNSCSFENDVPILDGSYMIYAGYNVTFVNCRFLHNYQADGANYFITSQTNNNLHLSFKNCVERGYTGSQLKSVVYPGFGEALNYGSVYEDGNNFSIYDTVYNQYKPYIQRAGQPLTVYSTTINISKMVEKTVYNYRDETAGKWALVYMENGVLYDYLTNMPYGVTSIKAPFTPETGTDEGCYYELINNHIVHIHIAVSDLTANTAEVIYAMPTGLRPAEAMPIAYANTNSTPSQYTTLAYGQITSGGSILKYANTKMYADIYYTV